MALGQWTFNRTFRGAEGVTKRDPLEFPTMAGELGFEGVDYSGILLGEHHAIPKSLDELNRRAADAGVQNVLILIDLHDALGAKDAGVGAIGATDFAEGSVVAPNGGCLSIDLPSAKQRDIIRITF